MRKRAAVRHQALHLLSKKAMELQEGRKTRPIFMPHTLLSFPSLFSPRQKNPHLGLKMKQLQHLVKSVFLLLENIHAKVQTLQSVHR